MGIPIRRITDSKKLDEVKRFLMTVPSGAELHRQIAEGAYYKSAKRGFEAGFEEQDWIEAEREILGSIHVPISE